MQRREMTRRGQNPYANPSAPSSYAPVPSSYNPPTGGPSSYSAGSPYDAPSTGAGAGLSAKPFKTKGMQLGAGKGRKKDDDLAAALGGLQVDDADLAMLQHQQQAQYEESAPAQQYQAPPTPVAPASKDVNPFGAVEQGE